MKQLELELQKRLLIVNPPEGQLTAICNEDEVYYAIKNDETYIKIVDGKKWKLICKGPEFTEEIVKNLVFKAGEAMYYNHCDEYYHNSELTNFTVLESFISAIEAKGYYWGENPVKDPCSQIEIYGNNSPETTTNYQNDLKKFQDAESRTFNLDKIIIFEIL